MPYYNLFFVRTLLGHITYPGQEGTPRLKAMGVDSKDDSNVLTVNVTWSGVIPPFPKFHWPCNFELQFSISSWQSTVVEVRTSVVQRISVLGLDWGSLC